ncbi:MAG: discoidin domain-containing protein [Verrucomicrobia bacterium]|nr:discoidin domain-containing protein [Verrucomicrobiota bacterium]
MSGPGYFTDTHNNGGSRWAHAAGDTNVFVTFDLGTNYELLITRIWNANLTEYLGSGTKDFRISVSADNTNYTNLGTNTLGIAGGTTIEPAQDFSTPAAGVRYVRVDPLTGYGSTERALGAVRFVVAGPQQPLLLSAILQGVPGLHYQVQYVNLLGGTDDWQVLDYPALLRSPYNLPLLDGAAPTNAPQQFYRAVYVP